MIKRSTVVMVILLAALAGLAYYLQQPNNAIKNSLASIGTTPTTPPLGTLLPPNAGPLSQLRVQSADGQSATLINKATVWTLTIGAGQPGPAEQAVVQQALNQLLGLSVTNRVQPTGADLSPYGLDKPAYLVTCVISDGSSVILKIGKPTVTDSNYYIQREDGSIVTADKTGIDMVINLLRQPPYPATATSPPVTETETTTPVPTSAETPAGTPITELTPTKQP
jgi:hypothetical protein